MVIHPGILAWRIPWTEEPGKLLSIGRKESDMTEVTIHTHTYTQLIYNVLLVSGIQQSDSVVYIHMFILFRFFSHTGRLSEYIRQSFLCYTEGPCWLPILYTVACMCSPQVPDLFLPQSFSFGSPKFVFDIYKSASALEISSSVSFL